MSVTNHAAPDAAKTGSGGAQGRLKRVTIALRLVQLGPVLLLIVLLAALSLLSPVFLSATNLGNIGLEAAVVAILALGQLAVILTAGIDLSVGSATALAAVCGGLWVADLGIASGWLLVPTMILAGGLIGAVNGLLFVKGRMPHPFLPTLAMLQVARGLALILSDGQAIPGMPPIIRELGAGSIGPIPYAVLLVAAVALLLAGLLRLTPWGQWIFAVGTNREGARRVGVPVDGVLISVYIVSGLCAGVAAIVVSGQVNAAYPTAGSLFELQAIAAVIIGGASFFGGRGSIAGAIVGALILGSIQNGLNLLNVSSFWQLIAIGVVIALAVEMDVFRSYLENRLRVSRTEATEAPDAEEAMA